MTDAAFEALLTESRPIRRRLSRRFWVPGMDREDMEQILALAVWLAMANFDPARSPLGFYLRMTMLRAAQSVVKSAFADARRAHVGIQSLDEIRSGEDGHLRREPWAHESGYLSLEDADWQEDLIAEAHLTRLERESFLGILGNRYIPGILSEIAADLGVTADQVGNAWSRARGKLGAVVALREPHRIPEGVRVQIGWRLTSGKLCMDGQWYKLRRWSRAQPDCYEAESGGQTCLVRADRVIRMDARAWGGRAEHAVGVATWRGPMWAQESFGWEDGEGG